MPTTTTNVAYARPLSSFGFNSKAKLVWYSRNCVSSTTPIPGGFDTSRPHPHFFRDVLVVPRALPKYPSQFYKDSSAVGIPTAEIDPRVAGKGVLTHLGSPTVVALNNELSARFSGKVRKGHASLGVSLGEWRSSRDMIVSRLDRTRSFLERRIRYLNADPKALGRVRRKVGSSREPLADLVLEGSFGWAPLVQDLNAAARLLTRPIPNGWVTARAVRRWYEETTTHPTGSGSVPQFSWYDEMVSGTLSARVSVSNPNLYLLNQAGLINLPGVVWDLIPWSFIVGAFANVNQFISSFTDEVGLEIRDRSLTHTWNVVHRARVMDRTPLPNRPSGTYSHYDFEWRKAGRAKTRSLISSNPVTLTVRAPKLDWGGAVIASSLLLQRVTRLSRLVGIPT